MSKKRKQKQSAEEEEVPPTRKRVRKPLDHAGNPTGRQGKAEEVSERESSDQTPTERRKAITTITIIKQQTSIFKKILRTRKLRYQPLIAPSGGDKSDLESDPKSDPEDAYHLVKELKNISKAQADEMDVPKFQEQVKKVMEDGAKELKDLISKFRPLNPPKLARMEFIISLLDEGKNLSQLDELTRDQNDLMERTFALLEAGREFTQGYKDHFYQHVIQVVAFVFARQREGCKSSEEIFQEVQKATSFWRACKRLFTRIMLFNGSEHPFRDLKEYKTRNSSEGGNGNNTSARILPPVIPNEDGVEVTRDFLEWLIGCLEQLHNQNQEIQKIVHCTLENCENEGCKRRSRKKVMQGLTVEEQLRAKRFEKQKKVEEQLRAERSEEQKNDEELEEEHCLKGFEEEVKRWEDGLNGNESFSGFDSGEHGAARR
jgi:hypothetical protein